jgi:hypothetical protein
MPRWLSIVIALAVIGGGVWVLVTGSFERRGRKPSPTMARIGGAALVFVGGAMLYMAVREGGSIDDL